MTRKIIMDKPIHEVLKETRLKKGIDLEKVSEDTFIPVRFLKDMEEGNWNDFPSFVHRMGFLKKYLEYLNIPREIIDNCPEFKPVEKKIDEEKQSVSTDKIKLPRYLFKGFIVILILLLAIFFWTSKQKSNVKIGGQQDNIPAASKNFSHDIVLKATEDVWIRVFSDGTKKVEKTLKKNDTIKISGHKINIRVGNAGALFIEKDGETKGPFGKKGQVVEIKIEDGLFLP